MKTLSIKAEFAYLVAAGIKDVENRTWQTKHRGKILIHASGKDLSGAILFARKDLTPLICDEMARKDYAGGKFVKFDAEKKQFYLADESRREEYELVKYGVNRNLAKKIAFPAQAIIGEVELVDIVRNSESPWAEPKCYHWIFKNARLYDKPITQIKGKLNLWEFSPEGR